LVVYQAAFMPGHVGRDSSPIWAVFTIKSSMTAKVYQVDCVHIDNWWISGG